MKKEVEASCELENNNAGDAECFTGKGLRVEKGAQEEDVLVLDSLTQLKNLHLEEGEQEHT